jgi:hypothetical protein
LPSAATTGAFSATLGSGLVVGTRFHVLQILPTGSSLTEEQWDRCDRATVFEVKNTLDWGRVHADFSAGILISNDSGNSTTSGASAGSGNFSQAHQFFALLVEKYWMMPGCYMYDGRKDRKYRCSDKVRPAQHEAEAEYLERVRSEESSSRRRFFVPGLSSFFESRLTAIPINTTATTPSTTSTVASGILTTAQTARVDVGFLLPLLAQRWTFEHRPNALFIAPMAKAGFDTVTGPTALTTVSPGGTGTSSQTLESVYNFWGYGARIGHMELTRSVNKAPETYSYIDILVGPYSNLQSYVCHEGTASGQPLAGSTCVEYGVDANNKPLFPVESRKRLYRLDIEGLLKIPKTILYVGFNANIGQRSLGAVHLDHGYSAPDDLRFFFGTKLDIAAVLSKFNFGNN